MRCVIPGKGIRAFGKAIYCLAKIGDEMFLEALSDGLALKTVNSARSAYASFVFDRKFFHSYNDGRSSGETDDESLKCKISIKSCVSVFKALSTLEKTVDHFTLKLDLEENKLLFVFHCKHGIVKTHNLGFQESEAVQAVFNKDLCPNYIAGSARILSEVVTNFPTNLDEVTMIAEPGAMRLQNYVDDEGDGGRVSLTEISLMPSEFDEYQIGVDVALTFCLKELRAILLFTDAINHNLSFRFEGAGKPVVISIDDTQEYQADFVLATLLGNETESQTRTTSTKRVANGLHATDENGTDLTEQSNAEQEDNYSTMTNSHQSSHQSSHHHRRQQSNKTTRPRTAAGRGQTVMRRSAEESESNFPSGSQFGTTSRNRGESRINTFPTSSSRSHIVAPSVSSSHVPPPPSDHGDVMEMESPSGTPASSQHRTTGMTSTATGLTGREQRTVQTTSVPRAPKDIDDDFMDALFEMENLHDVADEGSMFGLEGQQQQQREDERTSRVSKHSDRSSNMSRLSQNRSSLTEEDMDTDRQEQTSSQLDKLLNTSKDKSQAFHNTTAPGQSREAGSMAVGCEDTQSSDYEPTQDSIVDDSGFIPSTPPAKKFKTMPVLYGMDMFGGQHDMSEVLAPDSEDEGDS